MENRQLPEPQKLDLDGIEERVHQEARAQYFEAFASGMHRAREIRNKRLQDTLPFNDEDSLSD
jgi:hypothetical protein